MKEKKSHSFLKAGAFMTCLVIGVVSGFIFSNVNNVVIQTPVYQKSWHLIPLASEANPGAGIGGILEVYFINYTAGITPTSNTTATLESYSATRGWQGWNNTDNFRQRMNTSTFYVVVRVRGNASMCKRTVWQDTDLRVRWTCADLSIGADTVMERVITKNTSTDTFIWINFYDDNSNAGFALTKANTWPDNPITISSIKLEAYY
ncbi:MAG: hypothetical protein IMZ52_10230 [Actinobacteria bacterium]|nr:hypothetical protein [Actinomycetota bacterium]MBE3122557.1 hypothetical protein [Thermoplasmata archaeon]